ncbi:MAG: hypothetical protein QOH70_4040 [Blastocatellia bacterium]|jgi:hypothetical protein|nr:hypothetical protein [Blastocatellia bacterium]
MGKKTHIEEESQREFDELEQQVYEAFLARGWIIPQTEGDVSKVEAKMTAEDHQELPFELRDPHTILNRVLEGRSKILALSPPADDTPELLARAAREGKDIPPDIEERMRHDREKAERKAKSDL